MLLALLCECVKFICHLNAFLSSSATKCVWLSHCWLGFVSLSLCFYCHGYCCSPCVCARLNLASMAMHYTMRPKVCNENVLAIIYYVVAGVEGNSTINCCCLLSINGALTAKMHSSLFARLTTVQTLFNFSLNTFGKCSLISLV